MAIKLLRIREFLQDLEMRRLPARKLLILALTICTGSLLVNLFYVRGVHVATMKISRMKIYGFHRGDAQVKMFNRSPLPFNASFVRDTDNDTEAEPNNSKLSEFPILDISFKNPDLLVLNSKKTTDTKSENTKNSEEEIHNDDLTNKYEILNNSESVKLKEMKSGVEKLKLTQTEARNINGEQKSNEDYNADIPNDFRDTVFENEIMSFEAISDVNTVSNTSLCPEHSPHLIGSLAGLFNDTTKEALEEIFPFMETGGRLRPKECIPRERLAIIIPYRNRYPHLHIALHNLIPFLQRQLVDVTFFVIEQAPPSTFNRGALLNIGFLEAEKLGSFDCFIFHDVDLIPLNDYNLYKCDSNPRHYAVAMNKYNYKLLYNSYFGGVVGFSKEQYLKINGNSNLYVGWGGEDDDLLKRILHKNYKMLRYPNNIAKYNMIKHTRDKGNEANPLRKAILRSATTRQDIEGLNTVKYKVLNISQELLYTWITVTINTTEIILSAPAMTVKDVQDSKKRWEQEKAEKEKALKAKTRMANRSTPRTEHQPIDHKKTNHTVPLSSSGKSLNIIDSKSYTNVNNVTGSS